MVVLCLDLSVLHLQKLLLFPVMMNSAVESWNAAPFTAVCETLQSEQLSED